MSVNKRFILGLVLLLGLSLSLIPACQQTEQGPAASNSPFTSVYDTTIGYVGMSVCRSCHADVYESYRHTGMGLSFERASRSKSKASFGPEALVYDAKNDLYYRPFFEGDSLYVLEFRLEGRDTLHRRLERIDYIIGSGHHTNSHLIERNGYLYQAPITYYTQEGRWDLAPGFEDQNERFSRWIGHECLTCHNHLPEPVAGSEHKYAQMPQGIECERCHGPGAAHVKARLGGTVVDTSLGADYSIVNPRRLPIDLQTDLCQRCHLQGIAVLEPGRSFYDFRPGMALNEIMKVYLPRFDNSDKRFIMASQADRLQQSACYKVSQQLSCISCHHPHYSVKDTVHNRYTRVCQSCHHPGTKQSKLSDCSENKLERAKHKDQCYHCHMPKSGSIDIPHVHITDHYIHKGNTRYRRELEPGEKEQLSRFLGLQPLNRGQVSALDMAKGYLALFDKYMPEPLILDSVWLYLQRSGQTAERREAEIHYHFSRQDYAAATRLAPSKAEELSSAWTAYRLGEAYNRLNQGAQAQLFLERAVALMPYHLDFREKLAVVYARNGLNQKAIAAFEWILKEEPKRHLAWANYGLMLAASGQFDKAVEAYNQALSLDPDHETTLFNLALLHLEMKRKDLAREPLRRLLRRRPDHVQAAELWRKVFS